MHIPLSHYSPTPCHGMRWARIAAMLAMLAPLGTLSAQDYPQKDSTGATIYYKIFSASPLYEGMCLQDNTRTDTQYPFGLAAHEAGSRQQEWTLVPGTTEGTYLLKNRATYRFVAAAGNWVDAFFATGFAAKANAANQLLFTPVGDGQVTMTYQEGTTTRYMLVGDTERGPEIFEKKGHKDSSRAWLIYPSTAVPSDIHTASGTQVSIQAVGRRIVVSGTSNYDVYDIQGRRVDSEAELLPGVYVVEAAGTVKNVLVK